MKRVVRLLHGSAPAAGFFRRPSQSLDVWPAACSFPSPCCSSCCSSSARWRRAIPRARTRRPPPCRRPAARPSRTVDATLPEDDQVRARVGDLVNLTVESDTPGGVALPDFGETEPVAPGAPAHLRHPPDAAGDLRRRLHGLREDDRDPRRRGPRLVGVGGLAARGLGVVARDEHAAALAPRARDVVGGAAEVGDDGPRPPARRAGDGSPGVGSSVDDRRPEATRPAPYRPMRGSGFT